MFLAKNKFCFVISHYWYLTSTNNQTIMHDCEWLVMKHAVELNSIDQQSTGICQYINYIL